MAKTKSVVLVGHTKLDRMLSRLSRGEGREAIRKSARPALRPVQAEAKRLAPYESGQLEGHITIRAMRRSRKRFGYRVTCGEFEGDTFYGGFLEWGWKTGKRGSANRRQVLGEHFMLRAATNTQRQALQIYYRELRRNILLIAQRSNG